MARPKLSHRTHRFFAPSSAGKSSDVHHSPRIHARRRWSRGRITRSFVRTKGSGADSAIRLLTPLFVSALLPPKSPWQTGELLPVDGVIHGRRDGQQRDEFSGCIEHTPSQRPYRIITLLQRHAERSRALGARSLPTLRGRSSARDVRDIEPLAP